MKQFFMVLFSCIAIEVAAQPVVKNVIVEHFTNTYCSICASRNPGFYNNLIQYPDVLHIAYYPSAPYAACPLNQHNTTENDARTNFYGIYGATPRIVIQGAVIPAASDYSDSTIFQAQFGQNTPFDISMSMHYVTPDSIQVRAVIKKSDTSSISLLQLYGAVVEDTLFFAANNGETHHYNVFRKAVWTSPTMIIPAPVNTGDSVVYTQTISTNSSWNMNRIYSLGILQDSNKGLIQAKRSDKLSTMLGLNEVATNSAVAIYPNPVTDKIYVSLKDKNMVSIKIIDMKGGMISHNVFPNGEAVIDVSMLSTGIYFMRIVAGDKIHHRKFIKR